MKYFFNTPKQLETLICGKSIQTFADSHSTKEIHWELFFVEKSKENENLYFAEYDCPKVPNSQLHFTCEVTPQRHICTLTKLCIKGEAQNV